MPNLSGISDGRASRWRLARHMLFSQVLLLAARRKGLRFRDCDSVRGKTEFQD